MTITVSRSKLYPTPGKNYRVAWKWVYDITVPGEPFPFSGEGLSWAKGIAKKYAKKTGLPVVYTWEATA